MLKIHGRFCTEELNMIYCNSKRKKMNFPFNKIKKKLPFILEELLAKAWTCEQLMIQLHKLMGHWTGTWWKGAREHSFIAETKFEQTSTKMFFKTKSARSSSRTFGFERFQLQQCRTDLLSLQLLCFYYKYPTSEWKKGGRRTGHVRDQAESWVRKGKSAGPCVVVLFCVFTFQKCLNIVQSLNKKKLKRFALQQH